VRGDCNPRENALSYQESIGTLLRHIHGTLLHVQGTPLTFAQAQLGHSYMATTLEIYTQASVIAQREAVNLLDEQMFPSVPKNADGKRSTAKGASPTN
jgi:site-specific recombinase XerD